MTKAQHIFGLQYHGLGIVLDTVSEQVHVHLCPSNYANYKWQILDEAMAVRPNVPDLYEMASIIEEILSPWVTYNREDLDEYQNLLDSLVP